MSFTGFSDNIPADATVANEDFFPSVNVAGFQAEYRLPGEYRQEMLENRLRLAMIWANGQLNGWRLAQLALGHADLDAVAAADPGMDLGGANKLELLYLRAVSCRAKAMLLADYQTMMRKTDAQSDSKESEDVADRWYQMAAGAINEITGNPRIRVEAL
jgi:hypothetical protein